MTAPDDDHRRRLAFTAAYHCGFASTNTSWTDDEMRAANPPMLNNTAEERESVRRTAAWMRRFADALDAAALSPPERPTGWEAREAEIRARVRTALGDDGVDLVVGTGLVPAQDAGDLLTEIERLRRATSR